MDLIIQEEPLLKADTANLEVAPSSKPTPPTKGTRTVFGRKVRVEYNAGDYKTAKEGYFNDLGWPMYATYGYFVNTAGNDREEIDVFLGPNEESTRVFILPINKSDGTYDEDKILVYFDDWEAAKNFGQTQYYDKAQEPIEVSRKDLIEYLELTERPAELNRTWAAKHPARSPAEPSPVLTIGEDRRPAVEELTLTLEG